MKSLLTAILLVFAATAQVRAVEQSSNTSQSALDCKRFAAVDFGELDAKKVISTCQSALRINPDDYRSRGRLGRGYLKAGQDELALQHTQRSADKGDLRSMTLLAYMYKVGRGVSRDDREAVRLYRKAAESGYTSSMEQLGLMYKLGRGVSQDYHEAVRWFRKAAEKGSLPATGYLGSMYKDGHGVKQDDREAVRLYRKAADKGSDNAMVFLGNMYLQGRGVQQNNDEAVRWFRKAKGNIGAAAMLGVMYLEGRGVQQNDREAVRLFRKTANQGFPRSMYYLGLMYEAGRGVGQNSKIAAFHVFRSLKAGDKTVHQKQAATQGQWRKAFYLELQRLLQKEGVYSGPLDGQTGPALLKSIKALQRK